MEYLVVSATALEIEPLISELKATDIREGRIFSGSIENNRIHLLITGVGMMHAAYHLGRMLENSSYDHVIQAGIAGAFDKELKMTEIVEVCSQQSADLGFPGESGFSDVFDMGLHQEDQIPYWHGKLLNPGQKSRKHNHLKKVTGVSVNCISSDQAAIDTIVAKYDPDVEVMEGVALHFACLSKGMEYSEIRAISNFVEVRDKNAWMINESIAALNQYLISWLKA